MVRIMVVSIALLHLFYLYGLIALTQMPAIFSRFVLLHFFTVWDNANAQHNVKIDKIFFAKLCTFWPFSKQFTGLLDTFVHSLLFTLPQQEGFPIIFFAKSFTFYNQTTWIVTLILFITHIASKAVCLSFIQFFYTSNMPIQGGGGIEQLEHNNVITGWRGVQRSAQP